MDTFSFNYGRSPFSLIRRPVTTVTSPTYSAYSKSMGSLNNTWEVPLFLDVQNGSGFSPLRSPSRQVTTDGVRCHLKDLYLEQLSKLSNLWSSLLKNYSPTIRRRVPGDHRAITLYPSSKFLVVQTDEARIVRDFSKELTSPANSYKHRFRLNGEFGSGKTSLLYDLILDWCSDDSDLADRYPILLYVRVEYAYGRRTLEEVLQSLLPPPELKYVMHILSDRSTRGQVLLLVDECEKYTQPNINGSLGHGSSIKLSYDYENGDSKMTFPYPLDMIRLFKGMYLAETTIVFAGRSTAEQESLKRNFVNYQVYGLDDSSNEEFRTRNPLFHTLSLIVGDHTSIDRHDVLFRGIEKATTELLAKMTRPLRMSYEECIRILGWLSLIWCQDSLPPLTFDSNHVIERRKDLFQRDQRLREDADDILRAAIDCGLLITPGTGRLLTTTMHGLDLASTTISPSKRRFEYVLAYPHQAFALYLAARTFVSLNLNADWSRIHQQRASTQNGFGGTARQTGSDVSFDPDERTFFYFLTGVDRAYAQDLILRGVRRENAADRSWTLPWMVAETARDSVRATTAYPDEHFSVNGANECSDSILLNKLTTFYRSTQERSLELDCLLLRDEYDYEGTPITSLRFRHCNIYDRFLRMSSRRLFDVLSTLEFHDCQFYDEGVVHSLLMRLNANSSTLSTLRIVKCQKLFESVELMRSIGGQLIKLDTLQLSDVRDTERSQKAAFALAESLEHARSLTRLLLNKNEVADILFTVILYRLELDELDLSQCRLANETREWRKLIDALSYHSTASPLRKSLVTIRLDENPQLGEMLGLRAAFENCDRLKLISLKNSFRSPMDGERFKDALKHKPNANGLRRDVFV